MDNVIVAGLNKLHCICKAAHNGYTITISCDGVGIIAEKTVADNVADFVFPSIPSPERRSYRAILANGGALIYTRDFELGFGDTLTLGMYEEAEPATKGDIDDVEDDLTALETRLVGRISYGTTDKVDGSSPLQDGYIYCYI